LPADGLRLACALPTDDALIRACGGKPAVTIWGMADVNSNTTRAAGLSHAASG